MNWKWRTFFTVNFFGLLDAVSYGIRGAIFSFYSLPISEKQLPPVLRRKAEELEDNKPSKHQIKKEKRAERKKKKQNKYNRNISNNILNSIPMADGSPEKSDSESDADIEDNVEVRSFVNKHIQSGRPERYYWEEFKYDLKYSVFEVSGIWLH